ncbi:MAG TPA: SGNH/GDSL hydrolase family protein [Casimicrobiaceae bacterium]|nr:SGNH/GDSL hydrolase family protein [Casimicrobiaceae bacterium]
MTFKTAALGCLLGLTALAAGANDLPLVAAAPATLEAPAGQSRWEAAFEAFAADDAAHPHPAGGVLFVGSSSIRLWNDLEAQFQDLPVVIKRGFGGSQLSDCVKHLSRLVLRYRPDKVLVYAGDNDLAAGTPPTEVLRRFTAFVEGVHKELPQTQIFYISIKPSPSRVRLLPQIRETNELIREYADREGKVDFIDVFTPMLDRSGLPRRELFRGDQLHLNADGYALWKTVIAPQLRDETQPVAPGFFSDLKR